MHYMQMRKAARCPRFAPRCWTLTWAEKYSRSRPTCPLFAISSRSFRLDLHHPSLPLRIVPIAAPLPFLRIENQTAFHRIPMEVAQLHRELAVISQPALGLHVSKRCHSDPERSEGEESMYFECVKNEVHRSFPLASLRVRMTSHRVTRAFLLRLKENRAAAAPDRRGYWIAR